MGTQRAKVTVHGVPIDITEDRLGEFFAQYSKVDEVAGVTSKAEIATGDIVLDISLTRKSIADIPNILMYRERRMSVVVEGQNPYCWSCRSLGHMVKLCLRKNVTPQPKTTAAVWQGPW